MKVLLAAVMALNLLASCVQDTPTTPPDAHLPTAYHPSGIDATSTLAAMPWQKLYDDPVLQKLVIKALESNLTLESAYQSILAAQANYDFTRGKQQPELNAALQAKYNTSLGDTPLTSILNGTGQPIHTYFQPSLGFGASYEIDLFGRLASASAAARSELLATVQARNSIIASLVGTVAGDYFTLRELDSELEIAQHTLAARSENLRLVKARFEGGQSDLQEVRQAEESYYQVSEAIPQIERAIAQDENAISVLIGGYPQDIPRGLKLDDQVKMPLIPATGIPSELLVRRPDILEAEENIAAASGQVDVARKLLFPQLTISATGGVGYTGLNSIFYGPEGLISLVPSLVQPIFNGGRLKANVRLNEAQREKALLGYLQTVQIAMREVSDGVSSYNLLREVTAQQSLRTVAAVDSTRLAVLRYEGGQTSYLEVVDSQTRSFQQEIALAQARLNERLALVQLYIALGGGWQS